MGEANPKKSGTTAKAEAPVVPVKEKFAKFAEPPAKYKESRVVLSRFKFPGSTGEESGRGGLPSTAEGSDGARLLEDVPSGEKQQKLHRLAAKRFRAMNDQFVRDTRLAPLKVGSGWRRAAFKTWADYHSWCVRHPQNTTKPLWLGPPGSKLLHGQSEPVGEATLTATYPNPANHANRRPEKIVDGKPVKMKDGKLVKDTRGYCRGAKAFFSPHETGLAFDLIHPNKLEIKKSTSEAQKKEPAHQWLQNNAHLFGITPYTGEAFHWEVNTPIESWITGEDWVEGDNYAVRIKGTGRTGKLPAASVAGAQGPCPLRGLVGSNDGPKQDLTTYAVQSPEIPIAIAGARFPNNFGGKERSLDTVTGFVIHETGGYWGKVKSSGTGGTDPRTVQTVADKGGTIHFTVNRTGEVRQHFPLNRVSHASGPHNTHTISAELMNPVHITTKAGKEKWVNKSDKETAYPMLDKGFGRLGHMVNTPAQSEALWTMLQQFKTKLPNFPIKFPCADDGGSFRPNRGGEYPDVGIVAHQRWHHFDGVFVEYYCLCRSKGFSKMDAWYTAVGAAAKRGADGTNPKAVPLPTASNKAELMAFGKKALADTREKYKKDEPPPESETPDV